MNNHHNNEQHKTELDAILKQCVNMYTVSSSKNTNSGVNSPQPMYNGSGNVVITSADIERKIQSQPKK